MLWTWGILAGLAQCAAASRVQLPSELLPRAASGLLGTGSNDDHQGSAHLDAPKPPIFPDVYTVSFELSIPYLFFSQPQGLKFPVTVWYDRPNKRMRTEIYNGLDTTISAGEIEYTLYPRYNETMCGVFDHGPNGVKKGDDFGTFLPDMSKGWDYGGTIDLDGKAVNLWQSSYREGTKYSQYSFYVTADGVPIKFLMAGVQFFTGGHFDEYNYDFTQYDTSIVWPEAPEVAAPGAAGLRGEDPFVPPNICQPPSAQRLTARHPLALQAQALAPRVRAYTHEDAYHAFARAALKPEDGTPAHASSDLYARRLATFTRNVDMIHQHNADTTKGYTLRLNRWADWDEDEWRALMLPNRARRAAMQAQGITTPRTPLGVFTPSKAKHQLPKEVDWRGTGADPGVKDQGMCGSCFAFAATATMEGTWYVSTGQHRSFSEQQVLDCSWDWGNSNGCGGGDYQPAIQYVADSGGIALEQEYPYRSNSDFCRDRNASRVGRFKGWLEVSNRNEEALMEAVHTLGPIAVAVDAAYDTFRFYAEGVYTDSRCTINSKRLDHAVVLFGYGTTPQGVDYWLVRNTWSKFYGDDGHIKIQRGKGDCGISSDPCAAVVAPEAVVPGMAAIKALEAVKLW